MIHPKVNGTFKETDRMWVKVSGIWREVDRVLCNVNGVWKDGDYRTYCAYIEYGKMLKKVSITGAVVWEYTFSDSHRGIRQAVVNPDGTIYLTRSVGDWGTYITKISRDGELISERGSSEGYESGPMSFSPDGNIITSSSYWWGQSGKKIHKRKLNDDIIWRFSVSGAIGVEKMTVDSAGYIYFCVDQIKVDEDYIWHRTRLTPTGSISWRQQNGYDYGGDAVLGSYVYDHTYLSHGGGGTYYPSFSKINKSTGDIVFTKNNYSMYPWGEVAGATKMETDGQYLYVATRPNYDHKPNTEESKGYIAKVDITGNVIKYVALGDSYNPNLSVCPKGIYAENHEKVYLLDFNLNIIWQVPGEIFASDPGLYPVFSNRWN